MDIEEDIEQRYRQDRAPTVACKTASRTHLSVRKEVLTRAQTVAARLGVRFPRLSVKECKDIPGRRGFYRTHTKQIFLNRGSLKEQTSYARTFAHEVSHALARQLSTREYPHGQTWQRVMHLMGEPVAERYLSGDYDRIRSAQRVFVLKRGKKRKRVGTFKRRR